MNSLAQQCQFAQFWPPPLPLHTEWHSFGLGWRLRDSQTNLHAQRVLADVGFHIGGTIAREAVVFLLHKMPDWISAFLVFIERFPWCSLKTFLLQNDRRFQICVCQGMCWDIHVLTTFQWLCLLSCPLVSRRPACQDPHWLGCDVGVASLGIITVSGPSEDDVLLHDAQEAT